MTRTTLVLFVVSMLARAIVAVQPAWPAGAEDRGPDVTLRTISDETIRGRLDGLSTRDGADFVTLGGDRRHIPIRDIVSVTVADEGNTPARYSADSPRWELTVTMTNGDIVRGKPLDNAVSKTDPDQQGRAPTTLIVETIDHGEFSISLEAIARIDMDRTTKQAHRAAVLWFDQTASADEDQILLTNGDIVQGFIESIHRGGITLDTTFGETTIPRRLMLSVRMAQVRKTDTPSTTHVRALFRHSGRLTLQDLDWSGKGIRAKTSGGQNITADTDAIIHIEVVGGRWEWLSDHTPISAEHTPMLSLAWDHMRNRNVLGGVIKVAGKTFEQGIGVHSRSVLTYDLKGEYSRFVTYLGIDDDSGSLADVSVQILVDGQPRFEKPSVRSGRLLGPVRLDVRKADRITLVVDFGNNGDMQDRFNWVEPALIR